MVPTRIMFFILCIAFFQGWVCVASAESRALSVDDVLKIEGVGTVLIHPEGRWVHFERLRPYDENTDFSFRTYAYQKSGHQAWQLDLSEDGPPERMQLSEEGAHTYLLSYSPSGRYLSFIQYNFGALKLGAFDIEEGQSVLFDRTPAFSRTGEHNPAWLPDDTLVFASLPEGELPMATSVRAHTGQVLSQAWRQAWEGRVVTADEVRTRGPDRSGEPAAGALVQATPATGSVRILAEGLHADIRVSPDGRHIAALAVTEPRSPEPGRPAVSDRRRHTLTIIEVATGARRQPAPDLEFFPYTLEWSPDSRKLAGFGWAEPGSSADGQFVVVHPDRQTVQYMPHLGLDLVSERERGWLQRPERALFLGNDLAVFARPLPEGEDLTPRFSPADIRPTGRADPAWFVLSGTGASRRLDTGLDHVSGIPVHAGEGHITVWSRTGISRIHATGERELLPASEGSQFDLVQPGNFATRAGVIRPDWPSEALFQVSGSSESGALLLQLDGGELGSGQVLVAKGMPLAGSAAIGAAIFDVPEGPVSDIRLVHTQGWNGARTLAELNEHLSDIDFGHWEEISYKLPSASGASPAAALTACVLLPPGYDPNAPPPLVVDVYPDTTPRCGNRTVRLTYPDPDSPYIWAGKGYAYARLATPRALIRTEAGPLGGLPQVIEAGVDALVEARLADPGRLVLRGFSQGGVSALYVAAYTDRFGAVIAMNSWADFFSHYFGSTGIMTPVYGMFGAFSAYDAVAGSDFGMGQTPFDNPAAYYQASPVFLAPRIRAPVLLVHSDMDSFAMSQFDEMYGALLRSGKDARYVRYWGEGHGPSSPANIRDLWHRIDAFLKDHGVSPD